jgi:hypothetical protein
MVGWAGSIQSILFHFFLKSIEKQPAKVNMIAPVPYTGKGGFGQGLP